MSDNGVIHLPEMGEGRAVPRPESESVTLDAIRAVVRDAVRDELRSLLSKAFAPEEPKAPVTLHPLGELRAAEAMTAIREATTLEEIDAMERSEQAWEKRPGIMSMLRMKRQEIRHAAG